MRNKLYFYLMVLIIVITGCANVDKISLESFEKFESEVIANFENIYVMEFDTIDLSKGITIFCDNEFEYSEVLLLFELSRKYILEFEDEIINYQMDRRLMTDDTFIAVIYSREDGTHLTYEFHNSNDIYDTWDVAKFDTSLDVVADYSFDKIDY